MDKRKRFVQLVSFGPPKLPIQMILEAFDIVEKEYAPLTGDASAYSPVPDAVHVPPSDPVLPASIMGDTRRGVEVTDGFDLDSEQENADVLARLAEVTKKGREEVAVESPVASPKKTRKPKGKKKHAAKRKSSKADLSPANI